MDIEDDPFGHGTLGYRHCIDCGQNLGMEWHGIEIECFACGATNPPVEDTDEDDS